MTEPIKGVGNIVSTVQRSADGYICVACDGAGAFLLDGETLEIKERFNMEEKDDNYLPTNGTYCYYRDANGVNWFGFVRYGIAYTYHSNDLFKVFSVPATENGNGFTTDGIHIRTFCRHDDDLVLGTQNGFYYVNIKTGQYRYYGSAELSGGHIVNTAVWYDGQFYIGTFDCGLHVFDPQTMVLKKQNFSSLPDLGSIGDLKVGPDGRLWIGFTHGLLIVKDDKINQHFTEQNSHITGGLIFCITFDASGNAWLTGADGCSLYSSRSHEIVHTTFPDGFFNRQPWMRGTLGHDGLILMRTGPQTFYTNEQMTNFGELKLPVSFSDKWCRSLVDDMKGHYLLSSERGVFRFDYAFKEMQHFGYGEGLRGDFINDMKLDDDGHLWVATSLGLFTLDTQKLDAWKNDSRYKVQLVGLRRGSDLLKSDEEFQVNETRHITLNWNFNSEVLQLKPLLMDYSKETGRLYEYRLGGADWRLANEGEEIAIRHLVLGVHKLELRQAGAAGTTSCYTISVIPSFWALFELALFVLAIALLWLWWRFRKNTKVLLNERNEIEDALMEIEQQEALLSEHQEESEEDTNGNKYQQLRMSDEECADVVSRMRQYLENERAYTNPDLKRADLARVLGVSVAKLSYVFSMYLKENYYEFVNRYRLERFKQLIAEKAYKRFTLTALSEQCGFKKSSFFSTFRRVEGMTPTEYLKRQNIKVRL
jgi:AraC-like DNA-binding protein